MASDSGKHLTDHLAVCRGGESIKISTMFFLGQFSLKFIQVKMDFSHSSQRTIGLRFLYPVYYIPEVEVTPNKYTSPKNIEKGMSSSKYFIMIKVLIKIED